MMDAQDAIDHRSFEELLRYANDDNFPLTPEEIRYVKREAIKDKWRARMKRFCRFFCKKEAREASCDDSENLLQPEAKTEAETKGKQPAVQVSTVGTSNSSSNPAGNNNNTENQLSRIATNASCDTVASIFILEETLRSEGTEILEMLNFVGLEPPRKGGLVYISRAMLTLAKRVILNGETYE